MKFGTPLFQYHPQPDNLARDLWEQTAQRRWGQYLTQVEREFFERALEAVSQPGTALDIGAEQGRWTELLVQRGWQVTSTEICPDKVAACQSRNPQANCLLVSPTDVDFPIADRSIDLAVSFEVPVTEQSWFAAELHRILSDNGVAVFSVTNRSSYRALLTNFKCWLRGEEIYYPRSYRQLHQELLDSRFVVEEMAGFAWFPFSRFSDSRLVPWVTPWERRLGLHRLVNYSPWVISVVRKSKSELPVRRGTRPPTRGRTTPSSASPSRHP